VIEIGFSTENDEDPIGVDLQLSNDK